VTHRSYLIAEDEPLPAQTLRRFLEANWTEARCVGIATDGDEALSMIDEHRPDVLFLDVRMPRRDGLETARALYQRRDAPLVVFVTAFSEYAVKAFDEAAIDYLLKPVEPARLARCIDRLRERLANERREAASDLLENLERLLARQDGAEAPLRFIKAGTGSTVRLIPVEEILWFEAADKYVTVATLRGDSTIRVALRELLNRLDAEVFWQVHRSIIVNTRHVVQANQDTTGQIELIMQGRPERIHVSRHFAHLFRRM
jgi:DNA-binding LytR/AlgR family response regulator